MAVSSFALIPYQSATEVLQRAMLPPKQLFTCKVVSQQNRERVQQIATIWLEIADEYRQEKGLAPRAKLEREKSYETIRQISMSTPFDVDWDAEIDELLQDKENQKLLAELQESMEETIAMIVSAAGGCKTVESEATASLKKFWDAFTAALKDGKTEYKPAYRAFIDYLHATFNRVNQSEPYIAYDSALKVQGIAIQMFSSCEQANCAPCREKSLLVAFAATHPDNIAHPEKRVKGVGTALIHHIVHDMKMDERAPNMELRALETTVPFYKKIGLSVVPNASSEEELSDEVNELVRNEYKNGAHMTLRADDVDDFLTRHAGVAKLVDEELDLTLCS